MMLFNLLYTSEALQTVSSDMLRSIRGQAARNNKSAGITGLLLTSQGRFMEFLEGEAIALASTYAKICQDTRHQNVQCLRFAPATKRLYPDWALGVYDLDAQNCKSDFSDIQRIIGQLKSLEYADVIGAFERFGEKRFALAVR